MLVCVCGSLINTHFIDYYRRESIHTHIHTHTDRYGANGWIIYLYEKVKQSDINIKPPPYCLDVVAPFLVFENCLYRNTAHGSYPLHTHTWKRYFVVYVVCIKKWWWYSVYVGRASKEKIFQWIWIKYGMGMMMVLISKDVMRWHRKKFFYFLRMKMGERQKRRMRVKNLYNKVLGGNKYCVHASLWINNTTVDKNNSISLRSCMSYNDVHRVIIQ